MNPPGAVAPATWLRDRRTAILLLAVGLAVLLPEFVAGPSTSDSLRYNIVWLDQWRELVVGGNLYPRWMPRAWDGLGSPAFIFYPPLFFWIAVGLDQLTLRLLETGTLLSLTSAILLGASGLTMRHWLRAHVGAGTALLGALAYMVAPYHLYDIFARAALAETCAYAVLPLVLLGIKRAGEGNASALLALAVAYASLILSHLPVALLASVTLVPAYALFVTRRVGALARLAAAGLLGLGLAAIYLIPALTEGHTILAQALNTSFYRPENWYFRHGGVLSRPIMWIVVPACVAAVLLAFAAAIRADGEGRARTLFWAASSLAIVLLIAGVPPAFWQLPPIAQVQFPWRLMVVLEFAVITCVALSAQRLVKPLALLAAVPLTGAVCLAALLSAQRLDASRLRSRADIATIRAVYRDAPEYLPAGWPLPLGPDGIPNPSLVRLPQVPLVQARAGVRASVQVLGDGGLIVEVESSSPTTVIARRFRHGPWGVVDERGHPVRTNTTPDFLVSWTTPAGRSLFRLELAESRSTFYGRLISGLSLLAFLFLAAGAERARHGRAAPLQAVP